MRAICLFVARASSHEIRLDQFESALENSIHRFQTFFPDNDGPVYRIFYMGSSREFPTSLVVFKFEQIATIAAFTKLPLVLILRSCDGLTTDRTHLHNILQIFDRISLMVVVETPTDFVQLDTTFLMHILGNADVESQPNPDGPTVEFLYAIDRIQGAKIAISRATIELERWTSGRIMLLPEIPIDQRSNSYEVVQFTRRGPVGASIPLSRATGGTSMEEVTRECPACGAMYTTESRAHRHIQAYHSTITMPFNEWPVVEFRNGQDLRCPECGKTWGGGIACRIVASTHRRRIHGVSTGQWQLVTAAAAVINLNSDDEAQDDTASICSFATALEM